MSDSQKEIYTQIWKKYRPAMLRYCKGKLNRYEEDAKDIINEAFAILWEKIVTDSVPKYPQAFLYKTIDNLLKYKYRTIRRNNKYCSFNPIEDELFLTYAPDVAEEYEKQEFDEERIERLHNQLNDDEKHLLEYYYIEEKSYDEISEIFDSTKSAVKQKKFRISKKLHGISEKTRKDFGFN